MTDVVQAELVQHTRALTVGIPVSRLRDEEAWEAGPTTSTDKRDPWDAMLAR